MSDQQPKDKVQIGEATIGIKAPLASLKQLEEAAKSAKAKREENKKKAAESK